MTNGIVSKLPGWVVSLAAVALIYGVGNVLLVGGQKLWHRGEQQRLDEIKAILDHERPEIAKLEAQLQTHTQQLERESESIDQARAELDAFEARYPSGIPRSLFGDYQVSINGFNATVVAHNARLEAYEPFYTSYSSRIDEYNALVEEANKLSKAIGGTWYVIPVPRSSRTSARVRR